MTEALDEWKIAEVGEQGDKLADYYDSLNAKEIDFPKTPENDLITTSLHEAMLKADKNRLQNHQKLMVNKTENFKRNATPRGTRVELLARLYVSTAKRKDTGKEIAWSIL